MRISLLLHHIHSRLQYLLLLSQLQDFGSLCRYAMLREDGPGRFQRFDPAQEAKSQHTVYVLAQGAHNE
jgi:hypothetical protein